MPHVKIAVETAEGHCEMEAAAGGIELQQKLNNIKVDCVIDIYRSNILPAKITFDLTD